MVSAPLSRARVGRLVRTVAQHLALEPQLDFWIEEVDPTWSASQVRARIVDVIDEAADLRTFVLAPNARWTGHRAGQFVTVEVEINGVRHRRCYSISSAPGEAHLSITVKRVTGGRVASWMHDHLHAGCVLGLSEAAGTFVLPPGASRVLLLSGGSGVTPCMSILRDLARRDALHDVVFLHVARSGAGIAFQRELEALAAKHSGLRVHFVASDRATGGGRLDTAALRALVPDLADRETMLCGPPGLMQSLAPAWTEAGLTHRLHVERFAPLARPTAAEVAPPVVTIELVRSRRSVVTERSETLLEQLERGGERPAHGCRMGICHTCVCRKESGVVEDVVTGAVSSGPNEDIRLCVSRARTDVTLAL